MANGGFERPEPIGPGPRAGGGLRVVGIVLVVLGAAVVLVCAGGVYWLSRNPALREGFEAIAASKDAPGAAALRELGCEQAMVLDPAVFLRMVAGVSDQLGGLREQIDQESLPSTMVICNGTGSTPLDCDQVARTYIEAVASVPGEFLVQVASGGDDACQVVYAADGTRLGSLDELAAASDKQGEASQP